MCHFVTAVLPAEADPAAAARMLDVHGLGFKRVRNPLVQAQLREGEVYFCTTAGPCDCGTPLGSLARPGHEAGQQERELRQLRQQGWSDIRIQRWLHERQTPSPGRLRELELEARRRQEAAERWLRAIRAVLHCKNIYRLGLLLHWYETTREDERLQLLDRKLFPVDDLTVEVLFRLQEDILYDFYR